MKTKKEIESKNQEEFDKILYSFKLNLESTGGYCPECGKIIGRMFWTGHERSHILEAVLTARKNITF